MMEQPRISLFTVAEDGSFVIYYRGQKFFDRGGRFLQGFWQHATSGKLRSWAEENLLLVKAQAGSFEQYVADNRETIRHGHNLLAYCGPSDFHRINKCLKKHPYDFPSWRICHEAHLAGFGILPAGEYLRIEYDGLFCEFEYGENLWEILDSGFMGENRRVPYGWMADVCPLDAYGAFAHCAAGAAKILSNCCAEPVKDVLLGIVPSPMELSNGDVFFAYGAYPLKRSAKVATSDTDDLSITFFGEKFMFDVRGRFGYMPPEIGVCVDIDARLGVTFTLSDEKFGQQRRFTLIDLYE